MRNIISRNPFSGQIIEQFPFSSVEQISKHLQLAKEGYQLHRKRAAKEKVGMVKELMGVIEKKKSELAKSITFQIGKPIIQSQFQIAQALKICHYYTKHNEGFITQNVKTEAKKKTLVKYLPQGSVYTILPPTYPLLLNIYKVLPELMLGNGVIVRHSHSVPKTARIIQKIMKTAGFQSGEYQHIWNSYDQVETILKDNSIVGLKFAGEIVNGSKVAALAGKHLKKYHLQVSPDNVMAIFEDGNVQEAIQNVIKVGYFCSGQGVSPRKIIIHKQKLNRFKQLLIEKIKKLKFGDPQQRDVSIGPMIRPSIYQKASKQKTRIAKSNSLIFQKESMNPPFMPVSIFQCLHSEITCQVFGPVFQLFLAQNESQIIHLINKCKTVTNCSIFTNSKNQFISQNLEVSNIFLNTVREFDPYIPLGGSKQGGFWKEGWFQGIRNFANIRTSYIN